MNNASKGQMKQYVVKYANEGLSAHQSALWDCNTLRALMVLTSRSTFCKGLSDRIQVN